MGKRRWLSSSTTRRPCACETCSVREDVAAAQEGGRRTYETVRKLGQGGQGAVWLCRESANGRLLALKKAACSSKKAKRSSGGEDSDEQQLRWEAQVMKMLMEANVPGIVPLEHMAVDEEENLYLVLGYCEGGDLFSKVKESGKLTECKAAKVLRSLAETLRCCHALGVMHRDVKLENVLLAKSKRRKHMAVVGGSVEEEEEEEEVLLGDFGLASFLQPGQRLQTVAGTLRYMAPEVIRGDYDERADVWSLGMVMHALLTGTLPFAHRKDASKASVYETILSEELDLDASAYSHLSGSARELLAGMLCKDPARRLTLHQVQNHADGLLDMRPAAIKPIRLVMPKNCSKDRIVHQEAELEEERPVAHKQRVAGKRDRYMKQFRQRLRAAAAPPVVVG